MRSHVSQEKVTKTFSNYTLYRITKKTLRKKLVEGYGFACLRYKKSLDSHVWNAPTTIIMYEYINMSMDSFKYYWSKPL